MTENWNSPFAGDRAFGDFGLPEQHVSPDDQDDPEPAAAAEQQGEADGHDLPPWSADIPQASLAERIRAEG